MIRLVLLGLLLVLTGCTAPDTPSAVDVETDWSTPDAEPRPMTLWIPDLDIDEPLVELRRDAAGVLVPSPVTQPEVVGWYAEGVLPGEVGPAVIAGHVSGRPEGATESVPGVFARLAELEPGSRVVVTRNGEELAFEVYERASFRKDDFPVELVYGDTDVPEIRLVTCTGRFDPVAHSYEDNLVVRARRI